LAPPDVASGQIVILAAGRNQRALDDVPGKTNQNGLFTHELVQVIQSGNPEIRSAFEQVKQRVDDTAKRNGHEQRPSVVSDLNGNFYFFTGNNNTIVINPPVATVPPAVPAPDPAIAAEAEAYQAALKADVPEGYEQYLKDFPQARNASAIRIRLAAAKRKDLEATQQRDRQAAVAPAPAPTTQTVVPQAPATPVAPVASRPNPLHPTMVRIPAGSLARKGGSAIPIAAFDIGETEVTTAQYMACVQAAQTCSPPRWDEVGSDFYLKGNGSHKDFYRGFTDAQQPIVGVSWFNAQQYVKWLSAQTGQTFRLPKESEWEYAAWGGTSPLSNSWAHGNSEAELKNYAWYGVNSFGKSKVVKTLRANGFGLYDMAGNVWEWVQDCRTDSMPANGTAAGSESDANCSRVFRGGSWNDWHTALLPPSNRNYDTPGNRVSGNGFRVARTVF
jgi:formylglycine-generating enzyme required for sulfatase activity